MLILLLLLLQSKSPLLKSGTPQYFDRLSTVRPGRGGAGPALGRASSVGAGPVPRADASNIAASPPPPPSTPSRRLQLAQTRAAVGAGGQQHMQKTLEQQVCFSVGLDSRTSPIS